MAIALRSTSSATLSAAGTSITVNAPAGLAAGDVMYAVVQSYEKSLTAPSGWVQDVPENPIATGGSANYLQTFYKVAGASEPSSYTWSQSSAGLFSVSIADYEGVNNTTPLNVAGSASPQTTASPSFPSLTTTAAGCKILIGFAQYNTASVTFTPPSGYTQEVASAWGDDAQTFIADATQSAAGATGTLTGTISASVELAAFTAALNPASTSVTGTVAYTNLNDTSAISGKIGVQGTQGTQNANDALASAGKIGVIGTLIYSNAPDAANMAGLVNVYAGTLAYQNAPDLLAGSAKIGVQGTVSDANANDPATVTGTYSINGRLLSVMNNATMSATGGIGVGGALRSVMLADSLSGAGKIGIGGLLSGVNGADALIVQGVYQAPWQPVSPASGSGTASVPASGAWQPVTPASGSWTRIGKI